MKNEVKYRIQESDGKYLNAGTGFNSWFNLSDARAIVNRNVGQRIVECDGINILWEVFQV